MNALLHKISTKDLDGNYLDIEIRLGDPKLDKVNGHSDFAITCSAFDKAGRGSRADKYFIYGGSAHDDILKARPDLQLFVDLHLCDTQGAPMYAIGNGFYHLKNSKLEVARDYIRATDQEMEVIKTAEDETIYRYYIEKFGIPARWKAQADEGRKLLETWTGQTFEDTSTKFNFQPSAELIKLADERMQAGYYTPEAIQARAEDQRIKRNFKILQDLQDDYNKTVQKAKAELDVKTAVAQAGLSLSNFIYYNHSNEGVFNWLDYEKQVTPLEFENFVSSYIRNDLPPGIKFKLGTKGK